MDGTMYLKGYPLAFVIGEIN